MESQATFGWGGNQLNETISDQKIKEMLAHIKDTGYSGVTIDYSVNVANNGTVLDTYANDRMWEVVDFAQAIGLQTDIKVHWSQDGTWGNFNPWNTPAEFNMDTFLSGVNAYFAKISPIAQAHNVQTMFLGTENDNFFTAQYHAQWQQIVNTIHQSYTGLLSYDGNYMGDYSNPFYQVAVWDLVDKIGLSFYPNLTTQTGLTAAQIESLFLSRPADVNDPSWATPVTSVVDDIKALSAQYGKTITLSEVNLQAVADNLHGFIGDYNGRVVDIAAQSTAYEALFNVINKYLSGTVVESSIWGYDPWQYMFGNAIADASRPYDQLTGKLSETTINGFNWAYDPEFRYIGTSGADKFVGDKYDGIYVFNSKTDRVIEKLNAGNDTIEMHTVADNYFKYTVAKNVENVTLAEGTSVTTVAGSTVANVLTGNSADNVLNGSAGNDTLYGGAGNDKLIGGKGNDVLTGGAGNDIFVFDTKGSAKVIDINEVLDFTTGDILQFKKGLYGQAGVTADNVVSEAGAVAHDNNDYFMYDTSTGNLYYDADGIGARATVQVAHLVGVAELHSTDFLVI